MSVTLRPASQDDEPFLLQVYASTRLQEMALTAWDEAQRAAFVRMQFDAQRQHYQTNFPQAQQLVILSDGSRVGRLFIARAEQEIRILDLTVLPEYRNAGIGTSILRDIMKESERAEKPVHIHVENFNPSLTLFERLGFNKAGLNGIHFLMEWRAG